MFLPILLSLGLLGACTTDVCKERCALSEAMKDLELKFAKERAKRDAEAEKILAKGDAWTAEMFAKMDASIKKEMAERDAEREKLINKLAGMEE